MATIIKKHNLCKSIKNDAGKPLRKNRYVISHEVADGLLLYNTLTLGLIFLPGSTAADWDQDTFDEDTRKHLSDELFFVNEGFDEMKAVTQLRGIMKFYDKKRPFFTVFTTTACNARCHYCFESKWLKTRRMDKDRAKEVAKFIIDRTPGEELHIRWFGGEPLLNTEAIDIICSKLRSAGKKLTSDITTNAYRFNEIDVETKVKEWSLKRAGITIDGTPEVYRKIKNFYGEPANPFERVMQNIRSIIDSGVKVNIRLNVSQDNIDDIFNLVEILYDRFGKDIKVSAVPLYQYLQKETTAEDLQFLRRCIELSANVKKRFGMKEFLPRKWATTRCVADSDNTLAISPGGILSKCNDNIENKSVGDIYRGADSELVKQHKKRLGSDHCLDCASRLHCLDLKECWINSGSCNEFNRKKKEWNLRCSMEAEYARWKSKSASQSAE